MPMSKARGRVMLTPMLNLNHTERVAFISVPRHHGGHLGCPSLGVIVKNRKKNNATGRKHRGMFPEPGCEPRFYM